MKADSEPIAFPIIFVWNDTQKIHRANDFLDLQSAMEPNDVVFEELVMWDKDGRLLDYGVKADRKYWLTLNYSSRSRPILREFLRQRLRLYDLSESMIDELPLPDLVTLIERRQNS